MTAFSKKMVWPFDHPRVEGVCKDRICWLSQDNVDNLSFTMLCDDYEPHIHPIFIKVMYLYQESFPVIYFFYHIMLRLGMK